jgi:glycosyltransferase involved in cell wall biosynthesis
MGQYGEEESFLEMCRKEGLAGRVKYAGWVEPHDLAAHLALGDIALYPFDRTLMNRAKCPGKLVELMSMGKPIVADRVGEVAEYIVHSESGLLAEPEDVDGFVAHAVHLLDHPGLARKLGEAAQRRVNTEFSWDRITDVVEAAYRRALGAC